MVDNIAVVGQISAASTTMSRPRIVNSNIYTIDLTDQFRVAASRLPAGTLIKEEQFTLFEAVGALEIGDPKMDSGCVKDGESLEDDFDVSKTLLPTEIIWLMDELISREVAWHMGYPLSQTLFTSVYVEKLLWPDPVRLQDAQFSHNAQLREADPMIHKLFRSYCLGLVKSCDLVLGMVTSQHYYEEEDFATQTYNRELLHRFEINDIITDMASAIRYLQGTALDQKVKQSLKARMDFRFAFLSMLSTHTAATTLPSPIPTLDQSFLPAIQATRRLGTSVPDAFTLKIQRRLASTVPPRPMITIDEERTFDYLKHFIRDCENVFSVLCASHGHDLATSYSIFSSQDPQPSVYVRALLQSWLGQDGLIGGISDEFDFIVNDMRSITLAASPILKALHASPNQLSNALTLVKRHMHDFVSKNERSFLNIWRVVCLNRCRLRRTLCHAALEWDQIQAEAEELDDELHEIVEEVALIYPIGGAPTFSYSLSSWVYHYKMIQLRQIVQLGFELDIYAPHELPSMYWYLGQICDVHLAHLERVSFFVSQREASLPAPPRRSQDQVEAAEECRASLRHLYRHFSWLKATEATAMALHRLYIILQRHGQLLQPATTYASDALRYEIRMRPFLYLSIPEPMSFEQYRRRSQLEVRTDLEILDEATSHIAVAKKGWEEVLRAKWNSFPLKQDLDGKSARTVSDLWNADVRGAIKATIGTSIAIASLKNYLRSDSSCESTVLKAAVPQRGEKDYWHSWWLVPRLTV